MIEEDKFRVTSVNFDSKDYVIFTGIPLNRRKSAFAQNYNLKVIACKKLVQIEPTKGQQWVVRGKRTREQVQLDSYNLERHTFKNPSYLNCVIPTTNEGLVRFLSEEKAFKGIGAVTARILCNELNTDFHNVLSNDCFQSRNILRNISGQFSQKLLSEHKIDILFEGYSKYKNLAAIDWLSRNQVPIEIQKHLLKYHDQKSLDLVNENPYLIIGFGASFKQADKLAQSVWSLTKDEFEQNGKRLMAAFEEGLKIQVKKGNTVANKCELLSSLTNLLGNKNLVNRVFDLKLSNSICVFNPNTNSFHPSAQLIMEKVVAKRLIKLVNAINTSCGFERSFINQAISELPFKITKKQLESVQTCLNHSVSCITGGAGTGKTTVLKIILWLYKKLDYKIHAMALSGRAAMRLKESIGINTSTIAKFLNGKAVVPDSQTDKHLIVIDEASMLDLPRMYRITTHIHPSVRIIFSGDPNQLPPIGCGKILDDIVSSKIVANTQLDIVKRQSGNTGIPEYSSFINQGRVPPSLSSRNIIFHNADSDEIEDKCRDLYLQSASASRVVAPTKVLVTNINKKIQEAANSNGVAINCISSTKELKVSDQIIFNKNLYDRNINNGTLGEIISAKECGEKYGEARLDTGEIIDITQSILRHVELGYAITLHKAQGSQFERVIIALRKNYMVDRSWLYTAITRAEIEVHIVGNKKDFIEAVNKESSAKLRKTYLGELLQIENNAGSHY